MMKTRKERRKKLAIELPEEVIMYDILPRVHIKSLIKFKSVCKKWFRLITEDQAFITLQSQMCATDDSYNFLLHRDLIVISIDNKSAFKLSLPCPCCSETRTAFLGSSNGLVCALCWNCWNILVSNPITNFVQCIPNPRRRTSVAIAFDPSKPILFYTIVCCFNLLGYTRFEVFSSKTGEWRLSNTKLWVLDFLVIQQHNVFIGGKIYWFQEKNIVWLDVEDQDVAGLVPCPRENDGIYDAKIGYCNGAKIGDCNGELSYSRITEGAIEIWLLRTRRRSSTSSRAEFDFDWVKTHTVRLEGIIKDNLDFLAPSCHIMKSNSRSVYDAFKCLPYQGGEVVLFWTCELKIFAYNLRTRELKRMSACRKKRVGVPVWPFKGRLLHYPC